jgi:glycosyltransferase involved in cell wall biosynthesis
MNALPLVTVVVPVLDEEDALPELQRRLDEALAPLAGGYEVVYVDDGSTDGSPALIRGWIADGRPVRLVKLSRNFGMEIAMSAGVDHARGEYTVLMHADLQDPPELIPQMLELARGGADVVYARRIGREESRFKRALATGFYALMHRVARVPYQGQAGDFRMMSRRVVETLKQMPERRRFLRGMVAWVGFEQVPIEYARAGRVGGRGASYRALFRLALEALASFSDVPLNLAAYFGLLVAAVSGAAALVLLGLAIAGAATSGTIWILITVLFLGGVQLITVGILGRYLARVHDEALGRPLYLVDEIVERPATELAPPAEAVRGRRDRP